MNVEAQRDRTARPNGPIPPSKPTLTQLGLIFLRIGATGFGGSMAVFSLIGREMRGRKWVDEGKLFEAFGFVMISWQVSYVCLSRKWASSA